MFFFDLYALGLFLVGRPLEKLTNLRVQIRGFRLPQEETLQ